MSTVPESGWPAASVTVTVYGHGAFTLGAWSFATSVPLTGPVETTDEAAEVADDADELAAEVALDVLLLLCVDPPPHAARIRAADTVRQTRITQLP
jgi:hypothetical protein